MIIMTACRMSPSTVVVFCSERTGAEIAQLGAEIAQLGLHLQLSQESGAQLQQNAAAFEHQATHYQAVFNEHGERGRQVALLEVSVESVGSDVFFRTVSA